jgi:hypothetical protein
VEARKDAVARERIVAKLEAALAHGPKTVLGNRGFARFVRAPKGAVSLDRAAIERDARLDGKFVLRTNTALDPADVARAYKSLWRVVQPPPSRSARRPAGAGLTHVALFPPARSGGLAGLACRALESAHPGDAPAGLTAGPGPEAGNTLWTA